jgi:hypothetical protein
MHETSLRSLIQYPNTLEKSESWRHMGGVWAAFAKNPASGLETYGGGWPQYNASGRALIRLGFENRNGLSLAVGHTYDQGC